MKVVKCELCEADVSGVRCVFAVYRRVVDGREYFFCCERHADEFERSRRKR